MYEYDDVFYRYINQGAIDSAGKVLPQLLSVLPDPVQTVLDVGCGAGAWLSVWKSLGADVTGLDGDYVHPGQLLIDPGEFESVDLSSPFDLDKRFDLVQSLEVEEHLPAASATTFVESLCRHADQVLFSAAPPGQGGENHVNERPYDYWRELFRQQGYAMYDVIRPALLKDQTVEPWYRYNTFLFVNERTGPGADSTLPGYRLAEGMPVPDLSPPIYRLRKQVIRLLPRSASTGLAIAKKKIRVSWGSRGQVE